MLNPSIQLGQKSKKHLPVARFNVIYQELVKKPDDLVGLLAYSMYKQEKIDYIASFTKDKEHPPEPDELDEFHRMSMSRCPQYRTIAEHLMEDFQEEIFKGAIETLDGQYKKEMLRRLSSSKWQGIWQSLAGSVLYTLIIGAIVVIILGVRYGISGVVTEAMKLLGA